MNAFKMDSIDLNVLEELSDIKESQSHRIFKEEKIEGRKRLSRSSVQSPTQHRNNHPQTISTSAISRCIFNTSRDSDCITSLGNLF